VKLPPPPPGKTSAKTRESARRAYEKGQAGARKTSVRRSRAVLGALKREGRAAASSESLSRQGRSAARRRTATERRAAAHKAARTRARKAG
jgi:hypothetical protein